MLECVVQTWGTCGGALPLLGRPNAPASCVLGPAFPVLHLGPLPSPLVSSRVTTLERTEQAQKGAHFASVWTAGWWQAGG